MKKTIKQIVNFPFKKIYNFFLWASGANLEILKQAPTDKNKFFGIGGTIVFTALMASFAGGYAFFTAFREEIYKIVPESTQIINGIKTVVPEHTVITYTLESELLAIFFGLFWGALIFNLDRYIVSTFGVGDGKKSISLGELKQAFPRLIMAMILGFVIATPLELKLFEREINAEINTQIEVVNNTIIKTGENDPILKRLRDEKNEINTNILNRTKLIEEKRSFWEKANNDKNDEWAFGKFSGKKGKGGYYEDKKKIADDAENEYTNIKQQYSELNKKDYKAIEALDIKINAQEKSTRENIENQKTVQAQNNGLIARLKALDNLSYEEVENYEIVDGQRTLISIETEKSIVWYAKWLITIMFIFIEIAPILFKMMTERGHYDDILDRIKHEGNVKQLLLKSNINQEINTAIKIQTDKNEQKLNAELSTNETLLKSIANSQAEIAQVAIESWKNEQLKKAKENPSTIISS